jgi:hypothetical protein
MPIVSRTLPDTVSIPIAAIAKPIPSATTVLIGDEARESEKIDREILRRPERQRHLRHPGREKGDQDDPDQGAEGRRAEGGGERRRRPAVAGHRIAVEGRGDR